MESVPAEAREESWSLSRLRTCLYHLLLILIQTRSSPRGLHNPH